MLSTMILKVTRSAAPISTTAAMHAPSIAVSFDGRLRQELFEVVDLREEVVVEDEAP
jgi:hypothetical protein